MMICDWDYNVQCGCTAEEKSPPVVTPLPTTPVNSNPESTTPKPTIKPTASATSTQADCPTPPKCPTEEKECGWGIWVSRELFLLFLVHLGDINFTHRFPYRTCGPVNVIVLRDFVLVQTSRYDFSYVVYATNEYRT